MRKSAISRFSCAGLVLITALVTGLATVLVPTPVTAQGDPDWLTVANQYRAVAGVDPASHNAPASAGAVLHSKYLVLNRVIGHDEDPSDKGFTPEGRRAGLTGNVAYGNGPFPTTRAAVEGWMVVPFHGVGIIAPSNTSLGLGLYRSGRTWAATMPLFWDDYQDPDAPQNTDDVFSAALEAVYQLDPTLRDKGFSAAKNGGLVTITIDDRTFEVLKGVAVETTGIPATSRPVHLWPGDGTGVPLVAYGGSEWPDPLTSCKGFTRKAGLPIYIVRGRPTELASASVSTANGTSMPLCILSARTFSGADASSQSTARGILNSYGAVVIMTKSPLSFNSTYRVQATTTEGEVYSWSFRTTVDRIEPPSGNPLAGQPTPGKSSQRPGKSR
jgi:hypothetical protein